MATKRFETWSLEGRTMARNREQIASKAHFDTIPLTIANYMKIGQISQRYFRLLQSIYTQLIKA